MVRRLNDVMERRSRKTLRRGELVVFGRGVRLDSNGLGFAESPCSAAPRGGSSTFNSSSWLVRLSVVVDAVASQLPACTPPPAPISPSALTLEGLKHSVQRRLPGPISLGRPTRKDAAPCWTVAAPTLLDAIAPLQEQTRYDAGDITAVSSAQDPTVRLLDGQGRLGSSVSHRLLYQGYCMLKHELMKWGVHIAIQDKIGSEQIWDLKRFGANLKD
ncbi:uncharacterized protein LOC120701899 [Panicum virgatum]|uniref:uncharacterized protein LOC120701899 n=1 Tax=Panicum virgatum TaxID=38727 RepID=UPI0019D50F39|nr:uncharacterized protein LOC120701899 [Panicum virgatum]